MGTGSEGEEEVGREAWDFLEPLWGHGGGPAPCCALTFMSSGSGVSSRLQDQSPPLSNGTTTVPASRDHSERS